ncbi:MAG: hypothetical protein F6K62_12530 [Sphaerospermopsis sp. SIO1G2]|nr:hypothetical protein [Sphaerospermopsis sp. SIO1G2]
MSLLAILSFVILPTISTIYATKVYSSSQKVKRDATNQIDVSPLLFIIPILIFVIELPFILIGLLIGNLALLALIFWGSLISIPLTIYLIYGIIQTIKR